MILDRCPHCRIGHVQTGLEYQGNFFAGSARQQWTIVRCQNERCRKLVLVLTAGEQLERIFPSADFDLEPSVGVSEEIRSDFREAGLCLGAGCFKAALVMSRRALQRVLKEQGCNQRNLVDAIQHAVDGNILRPAFQPLANEIREYGNLGAHPDDEQLTNASRTTAEAILGFVRLLIHEFYELPAEAAKLRTARGGAA